MTGTFCGLCRANFNLRPHFPLLGASIEEDRKARREFEAQQEAVPESPEHAPPRRRRGRRRGRRTLQFSPAPPRQRRRLNQVVVARQIEEAQEMVPALAARQVRASRRARDMRRAAEALADPEFGINDAANPVLRNIYRDLSRDMLLQNEAHNAVIIPFEVHGFEREQAVNMFRESGPLTPATFSSAMHIVATFLTESEARPPTSLSAEDRDRLRRLTRRFLEGLMAMSYRFNFIVNENQ